MQTHSEGSFAKIVNFDFNLLVLKPKVAPECSLPHLSAVKFYKSNYCATNVRLQKQGFNERMEFKINDWPHALPLSTNLQAKIA